MPTIGIFAAGVFAIFALGLVVPATAAILEGNWRTFEALALTMTGYAFLSAITTFALWPRRRRLNRAGVFSSTIAIWLALVVAATPVFILVEGHSLARGFFEAASASVTLGVTLRPVEDISIAMGFYRGMTAWIGGLLTLLLAVYILGPYEVGGTPSGNLRLVQHARTEIDPQVFQTMKSVVVPYASLTALCALLLILFRVPPRDALIVAMSLLSTNGFVPHQTGASVLNNAGGEIVMMIFMIIGATSIIWQKMLRERRWTGARDHEEGMLFLITMAIFVALAVLGALVVSEQGNGAGRRAFTYAFDAISTMTTTGITHDKRVGVGLPFELVLLVVFIGGCSYSTAGGVKIFRLGTMLRHLGNELNRLVYPNAMLRDDVQYDPKPRAIAKSVWSAFFLAVLAITIGILLFAAQGVALPGAMALATGSFSQVGNIVTSALPGLSVGAVPDATLLTIAGLAIIARIEILVVLAALTGNRW
ncbi:potassium transporter TrkG [Pelagibacterium halotolerans]|uniref:potassium transporter TrkG n=1 Tax=Pelagibacterium halotolerans TaxID=531813 RepID=UPI00384C5367